MKPWKFALGLGAACAACCAIPLLGLAGGVTAFGSALLACAGEFTAVGGVLALAGLAMGGLWWWRRLQRARRTACGCESACSTARGGPCAPAVSEDPSIAGRYAP